MRIRIPPGTIPPNAGVDIDLSQVPIQVLQDQVAGGPPIEVSSQVIPDAMALYMLSTCIIDCTRALESHEAATRSHEAHLEQVRDANERAAWWSRAVVVACVFLAVVSLGNFGVYVWGWLHGH